MSETVRDAAGLQLSAIKQFAAHSHRIYRGVDFSTIKLLIRRLFETVLRRCISEGLVGGEGFAVDASLIKADANRQKGIEGEKGLAPEAVGRAVKKYLAVLDDAAFGAASDVTPKANDRTIDAAHRSLSRQALGRQRLHSADMLGWLVNEHGIEPHVTVFDKSARKDGTFSRNDFTYDYERDIYLCPGGKTLTTTGTLVNDHATMLYRASKHDCKACALRPRCCPNTPARKVPRSRLIRVAGA